MNNNTMRLSVLLAGSMALGSCSDAPAAREPFAPTAVEARTSAAAAARDPMHAEVEFGIEEGEVGSSFPPAQHDRSFHAFDRIRPGTVTIAVGGTVTFEVYPLHQPAVFEPGIGPEDIDTSETEPIVINGQALPFPLVRITDDDGRIATGPPQSFEEVEWEHTFTEPGRYLVICTTFAHFTGANMYAWVIVQ